MLSMIAGGAKARDISKLENMPSESRISVVRNSPAGKAFLSQVSAEIVQDITQDTRELITSHTKEAVQTVVKIMRSSDNDGTRLRASQDLLDRGGFKPVERQETVHYEVAPEDVARLVDAMAESGKTVEELHFYDESHKLFKDENEIEIIE